MTANAAHHMGPGTPAATAGACPACGGPLPDRAGRPGRPAAWCSKGCRQAAWRARRAAGTAVDAARQTAGQLPAAHRDLQHIAGALAAALHRAGVDAPTPEGVLVTGWQGDVAGWARRLVEAAERVAALTDAHAGHALDYRRAVASVADPAALGDAAGRIVAATAVEASATKPAPAPVGFVAAAAAAGGETKPAVGLDPDDLFDAVEDVLADVRDAPGIPQDVLQGVDGVPGMSFADALTALDDAHAAASGDGPLGELAAAAAAVVRAAPPYLPARADHAVHRLAAVVRS